MPNAQRSGALRVLPTIVGQEIPSLVMTYRNDPGAPNSTAGLYHLGQTEWKDIEAAADYALANGAKDLLLVGYSMGGEVLPGRCYQWREASTAGGWAMVRVVLACL